MKPSRRLHPLQSGGGLGAGGSGGEWSSSGMLTGLGACRNGMRAEKGKPRRGKAAGWEGGCVGRRRRSWGTGHHLNFATRSTN